MKRTIISILIFFSFSTVFAQYQTLYTSITHINFFKKSKLILTDYDEIYFQPAGLSGTPCSIVDPYNSNIYRLIPQTGAIYTPFDDLLNRLICNDINGGCYPIGFKSFEASVYDTSWIIGHRRIEANPQSINCNQLSFETIMSSNGGENFIEIFPDKEIKGISLLPSKSVAVVGIDSHIYRSTNMGSSFTKMGFVPGLQEPITVNFYKPYIILAGGSQNMYRSIDSGHTFTEMNVPVLKEIILDDFQGATYYGVSNSTVYRGNSFGSSWTELASISNINCIELDPYHDVLQKKIFIGTTNGFYISTNSGITFRKSGLVFPESNNIIGISKYNYSDTLIVCTEKAIHKVWDLQTGLTSITSTIPLQYDLKQNYPNPFNPSTNISFDTPERSEVTLNIYDGTGRIIAELVNSTLISGSYTYLWDASGNPSGVYYARFTARGERGSTYSDSKKLLLIK